MVDAIEPKLAEFRAMSAKRYPAEMLQAVQKLVGELEESHVPKVAKVGDTVPDFTLKRAGSDESIVLSALTAKGPVVLSFYRGQW